MSNNIDRIEYFMEMKNSSRTTSNFRTFFIIFAFHSELVFLNDVMNVSRRFAMFSSLRILYFNGELTFSDLNAKKRKKKN